MPNTDERYRKTEACVRTIHGGIDSAKSFLGKLSDLTLSYTYYTVSEGFEELSIGF